MIEQVIIQNWCKANGCSPKFYGGSTSLVILGEHHGNSVHQDKEESMIQLIRPGYLLHELMRAMAYDPKTGSTSLLQGVVANIEEELTLLEDEDSYRLIKEWAHEYGLVAVGIELSYTELEAAGDKILAAYPGYELTSQSPKECIPRERRMGDRMVEYLKKSDLTLVAIMGAHHMRPKSEIHPILQANQIGYACIRL